MGAKCCVETSGWQLVAALAKLDQREVGRADRSPRQARLAQAQAARSGARNICNGSLMPALPRAPRAVIASRPTLNRLEVGPLLPLPKLHPLNLGLRFDRKASTPSLNSAL